jgi:glycosyltransferase involved in cell wall biosynthesis
MKILWVKTDFLHPTNRGGQIRTLEMLRQLHRRNEIHYLAYDDPASSEGRDRASEYSSHSYPVNRPVPARHSPAFFRQLATNLFSPLPLAVGRYESREMKASIAAVLARHDFDAIVCDFLSSAPNIPDLSRAVLFQHNVESRIWERHAKHALDPVRRAYFTIQANRMRRCEGEFCRRAAQVVSVSPNDTRDMKTFFGVERVSEVPTGVDVEYFAPAEQLRHEWDLVFVGAMDWLPNVDGVRWFTTEVLPRIRERRPGATLALAGRNPDPAVAAAARQDPLITVTGTVPDIRPYLWNSAVSIVPLRVGGGTRLKIYEAMAAAVPVVSTHVGAEGLAVTDGRDILLADDPARFADHCLTLLESPSKREAQSTRARDLVSANFSWDRVATLFEGILRNAAGRNVLVDAVH